MEGDIPIWTESWLFDNSILAQQGNIDFNHDESGSAIMYDNLWKSLALSKVVAFFWMVLIDRIPMRSNLALRRVLPPEEPCSRVLCGQGEETTTHIFLHCEVASLIWRKVLNWLGVNFITPQNMFTHFACWNGEVNSRQLKKVFWLIWHASIWMIWKERNARIFKNQFKNFDEVVDDIKAVSWCWSLSRLRIVSCLLYEWCWNPRDWYLGAGMVACVVSVVFGLGRCGCGLCICPSVCSSFFLLIGQLLFALWWCVIFERL